MRIKMHNFDSETKISPNGENVSNKKAKIAGLIMVKNESFRIRVTLNSIKDYVSGVIIYDTGSQDDTIEIIRSYCAEHNLAFHFKTGLFVDFEKSRNELLDFADTLEGYDYHLHLDCNDELRGGDEFVNFCNKYLNEKAKVFMIYQEWLTGQNIVRYRNSRLVKSKCGWRYKKRVHEYLSPPNGQTLLDRVDVPDSITIFQNRNDDDDKTQKRYARDKEILIKAIAEENDPRDYFYLAQTLACMHDYREAIKYYQLRGDMTHGFGEERFHSFYRCGQMYNALGEPDMALANFVKATMIDFRAESLIGIGRYFRRIDENQIANIFFEAACSLDFPKDNILFIDKLEYDYTRWREHSVTAFYASKFKSGLKSLEMAEEYAKTNNCLDDSHKNNRQMYLDNKNPEITELVVDPLEPECLEIFEEFMNNAAKYFQSKELDQGIINVFKAYILWKDIAPLLLLADYCRVIESHKLSHVLMKVVCNTKDPSNGKKKEYRYLRWHLASIVSYFAEDYTFGKEACLKAIRAGDNIPADRANLKNYTSDKVKNIITQRNVNSTPTPTSVPTSDSTSNTINSSPSGNTKSNATAVVGVGVGDSLKKFSEYVACRAEELMSTQKMNRRQAEAKARLEWKIKNDNKKSTTV